MNRFIQIPYKLDLTWSYFMNKSRRVAIYKKDLVPSAFSFWSAAGTDQLIQPC